MQSATLILEVALKWEAVKGVISDQDTFENRRHSSLVPHVQMGSSNKYFIVAFRTVKGVHKTSATFCSTGKLLIK